MWTFFSVKKSSFRSTSQVSFNDNSVDASYKANPPNQVQQNGFHIVILQSWQNGLTIGSTVSKIDIVFVKLESMGEEKHLEKKIRWYITNTINGHISFLENTLIA